jgi:hypothetical protein
MSESIITSSLTSVGVGLACRVRARELLRGASPTAGEVELENMGSETLEIAVQTSPLQFLNLVVTDASGCIVSDSFYGDLFSPVAEPYTLKIQPGEKFIRPVSLLANVPKEKRQPGEYTVRAIYEYQEKKAISEPLRVVLPPTFMSLPS